MCPLGGVGIITWRGSIPTGYFEPDTTGIEYLGLVRYFPVIKREFSVGIFSYIGKTVYFNQTSNIYLAYGMFFPV